MTTDRPARPTPPTPPGGRGLARRLLPALITALCGWIAVLAITLRIGGEAPAVFVPFPPDGLVASLPDASVTGASAISLTLKSAAPEFPRRVYAAGAWLVLPAGLEACIPSFLRKSPAG